jgi:DNA-binding NtrC family response regulator
MARVSTILIVDDEEAIRDIAGAVLTAVGYRVLTAADGNEAIRIILAEPVDLLFTDVIMPGMSGYELACAAKSIQPALRVLYTSGFPGWTEPAAAAPRAHTLAKPWRAQQLVSEIDHALVG